MNKFQGLIIAATICVVILAGCADPESTPDDVTNAAGSVGFQPGQERQGMKISDVEALARANVSDDAIIAQLQKTHSIYHLPPTEIVHLHNAGVSEKVVNYMISTASLPAPPPAPAPIVVKSDYPPPPVAEPIPAVAPGPGYVWIGGEWQSQSDGWVWAPGQWAAPPWPNAVWIRGYWYRGPFSGWRHSPGHWR
jgi:WXXGXW repeat (2 copies)